MVTTVTTNPMLDKTLYLPEFSIGKIFRSEKVENVAGGKGINVSLQLSMLGVENISTGFLGGEIGKQIKNLLNKDNIKNDFIWVNGNTRIGFTVLNESNMQQTSVFEPNQKITAVESEVLIEKCIDLADGSDYFAIAGSVPDKTISGIYKEIITGIKNANNSAKIFFDAYGLEFSEGVIAKPFCVKQNKKECEAFLNRKIESENDFISALSDYKGIDFAIITNGGGYSYIKYKNEYFRVLPPEVELVNPIGCGDTMTAGFIYGFINNYGIIDDIKFAFAASAANASKWVIAKNKMSEIEVFIDKVVVEKL